MATPWPEDHTWPTPFREHAAKLSRYLQTALKSIDEANGQPIECQSARVMIFGTLNLLVKLQNIPDLEHLHHAVASLHTETKTANEATIRATNSLRDEVTNTQRLIQQNATDIKENSDATRRANNIAKEGLEANKMTLKMVRDAKALGPMNPGGIEHTYANVAARGGLVASIHNPQNLRTSHAQTLREIIVNIRDPITIENIRAMNPRSLKAHVDRAIEQSNNENINKLRAASANQLKSGDLSIKTATTADMEALRQFAGEWEHRIGNNATVRIPTYGILAHGIRTSSMNMDDPEQLSEELLQDNKPFIPKAQIKHISWLTRSAHTKSASSIVVEFSKAEDANKIIDEGLIWQGEVFQCERYDRQCRLRQCFRCHKYGHIGTQCKAPTTCGYCAQEHPTRECPSKGDLSQPRRCAACDGNHEAWHGQCPVRKQELAKVKEAYKTRPKYHLENSSASAFTTTESRPKTTSRLGRPSLAAGQAQGARPYRSRSPIKRIQKRSNPMSDQRNDENDEDTITVATGDPRPKRTITRTRRALESLDVNTQRTDNSNRMEITVDLE